MAEIRWTAEAEKWLKDIHDYISQNDPASANRVISGIYEKAQVLHDFPEIGYKYKSEPEGVVRVLLYGHYRLAYIIREQYIDILGVFHGALNIDRYLM